MRSDRRSPVTPSMAVALTALVVALGGTAFAAGGGFASSDDGLVQACVAKADIVNSVTDPVLGTVGSAAAALLGTVTTSVTPKGTVMVVAPGAKCPANTEPQNLSSARAIKPAEAHSAKAMPVGATKRELTSLAMPAGTNLITATVDVIQGAEASVDKTIKCVFVDAAGKTIANTTSAATIPAGASGTRLTIPVSSLVTLAEPGEVGLACKSTLAGGQSGNATRAASRRGQGARAALPRPEDMAGAMNRATNFDY